MSLNKRRILYIFFILIFIIATPLISLYATGYKVGSGFKVRKTGMLILDTEPRGAKIYLNDKIQQHFLKKYYAKNTSYITSPAKIKNLLPGEYNVRLELPGFWSWQKKLNIREGQSTFAEDVSLFKKNIPRLIISGVFSLTFTSKDLKKIAVTENLEKNKTRITLIDLSAGNEQAYIASTTDGLIDNSWPGWSPKNNKIIINNLIFDSKDWSNPDSIGRLIGDRIKNIKWDWGGRDIIYYKNSSGLSYYDLSANIEKTTLFNQDFDDYLPKGDDLFFIGKENGSSNLNIWRVNDERLAGKISLPMSTYTFLSPDHRFINLYDEPHDILYIIDPWSGYKPLRETVSNVNKTFWVDDNKLLYANDFEIWLLDLQNYKKTILTRISEPINSIIWHPSNNYAIFSTRNNINIIELDDREKYNIIRLIELNNIGDVSISDNGNILYFRAEIGNQKGLYKLYLQ